MTLGYLTPLAHHFTVYAVNRRQGLRPGESMAEIAGDLVGELFEGTAAGVRDGRVHLFEGWGHGRTCQSSPD